MTIDCLWSDEIAAHQVWLTLHFERFPIVKLLPLGVFDTPFRVAIGQQNF